MRLLSQCNSLAGHPGANLMQLSFCGCGRTKPQDLPVSDDEGPSDDSLHMASDGEDLSAEEDGR